MGENLSEEEQETGEARERTRVLEPVLGTTGTRCHEQRLTLST